MAYFTNFPQINYTFGTQASPTLYQNLGIYVDLLDQVKDDVSFYTEYDLQDGDRADQISQKLYNRPDLHWTFFMLNDKIKLRGWPRAYADVVAQAKKDYSNTTIVTRTDLSTKFKVGSEIEGKTSGQKAKIIRRLLDQGQLIVERVPVERTVTVQANAFGHVTLELSTVGERYTDALKWAVTKVSDGSILTLAEANILEGGSGYSNFKYNFGINSAFQQYSFTVKVIEFQNTINFANGEVISATEDGVEVSAVVDSSSLEYLATHHYEDAEGNYVDITPNAPFVQRLSFDLELAGSSDAQINAAEVKDIEVSTNVDYSANYDFSVLRSNIDKGFFTSEGSLFSAGFAAYEKVQDPTDTHTLDELLGVSGSTTDNDFTNNFPTGTDLTEIHNELKTELAEAVSLADTNTAGKYDITVHMFYIVDNQLDVFLTGNVFAFAYEYKISGISTFKNNCIEGGVAKATSPAETTQAGAWLDASTNLESYITANLSSFNPALLTQVTYLDRYVKSNNDLKSIKVLRPEVANRLDAAYQNILLEQRTQQEILISQQTQTGRGSVTVSNSSQPVTTVAGQTVTSSSSGAVAAATTTTTTTTGGGGSSSSGGSSGGGGYY